MPFVVLGVEGIPTQRLISTYRIALSADRDSYQLLLKTWENRFEIMQEESIGLTKNLLELAFSNPAKFSPFLLMCVIEINKKTGRKHIVPNIELNFQETEPSARNTLVTHTYFVLSVWSFRKSVTIMFGNSHDSLHVGVAEFGAKKELSSWWKVALIPSDFIPHSFHVWYIYLHLP